MVSSSVGRSSRGAGPPNPQTERQLGVPDSAGVSEPGSASGGADAAVPAASVVLRSAAGGSGVVGPVPGAAEGDGVEDGEPDDGAAGTTSEAA